MSGLAVLARFLDTAEADAGCQATFDTVDRYVEDLIAGRDPAAGHPGVDRHLRRCRPCRDDFEGLLRIAEERESRARERGPGHGAV